MKKKYEFIPKPIAEKFYFEFKGDFSSGTQFGQERSKIATQIEKATTTHLVILNFQNVIFWDTETMNFIKELVAKLYESTHRIGIIANKESYIFKRFEEKFGKIQRPIVWEESEAALIEQLKK